jgi:monofunctional biosynthetic peptidoglycan transglycosylase
MALFKNASIRRFLIWLLIGLGAIVAIFLIQLDTFHFQILSLKLANPQKTAFMENYLRSCSQKGLVCHIDQTWKPLNAISQNLQEAVLISEDDAFFEHEGIDPEAIRESIEVNLKKKKIVRGGSTITQQLAKNLYLSPSKNPLRKLKEIIIALMLERALTKQRILEIYLNVIEWGKGIYGAEAASQFYFKKSASLLSMEEAAYLAAIIPNPELLTRPTHAQRAQKRKAIILKRMQRRSEGVLQ